MQPLNPRGPFYEVRGLDPNLIKLTFGSLLLDFRVAQLWGSDKWYRNTFNKLIKFIHDWPEFKGRFPYTQLPDKDEVLQLSMLLEVVCTVPSWQIPIVCSAFAIFKVQDVFSSVYNSANSACSKIFRCRRPIRSV